MKTALVAGLVPMERFFYWIKERHSIYLKRKEGKGPPWTDDEVLQRYFFTNPYREHDKVTVWFRENIRGPLQHDAAVVFATVCFRWFNWIPTGKLLWGYGDLLRKWNTRLAVEILTEEKEKGNQIFTGAFNISNSGSTKPKINRVCEDYIEPVWQDHHNLIFQLTKSSSLTLQEAHKTLTKYTGLGGSGFMAYEIVCDLRYTDILKNAPDKLTWANPGPGAARGMNRLLERPVTNRCRDWLSYARQLLVKAQQRLGHMPLLEMREIEHSLCEWDKYERARLGEGHMKRTYRGLLS